MSRFDVNFSMQMTRRRVVGALSQSLLLAAHSAGQAAESLPLSREKLRVLEKFLSKGGFKDVPLNKGVTDALGITAASDPPLTADQIAREFGGRKRYFSFLPKGKGYIVHGTNERSVGIYHILPSLRMGKALGRTGSSGPVSPLSEAQARADFAAELRAWADFAETVAAEQ